MLNKFYLYLFQLLETYIINIDSVEKLILDNLTFTSIQGNSEDSYEIYILFLSKLILDGSEDSSISNIQIINSQIGFLNFLSCSRFSINDKYVYN